MCRCTQTSPPLLKRLEAAMGLSEVNVGAGSGWIGTKRALTVRNAGWGWWTNHTLERQVGPASCSH